ncbi:hypothetical protein K457DRAFT_325259 [Linnemannia elongata AG-77]|uniref:Uncharacterized protein n=1 Tax=Linnemannia elongata AG-77 TaxID=1314771 RepID=A0A197K6Y1_9FUNG|nr:hypothetical protein K457DRAFT_325259 [Linnemannia elongata AG-77]
MSTTYSRRQRMWLAFLASFFLPVWIALTCVVYVVAWLIYLRYGKPISPTDREKSLSSCPCLALTLSSLPSDLLVTLIRHETMKKRPSPFTPSFFFCCHNAPLSRYCFP